MAVASLDQMLGVTFTRGAISRVAASTSLIARKFGMQGGRQGQGRGPNVTTVGHRSGGYDIFNDSRAVGRSTAPGAPAAVSSRNPVGRVNYTIPRMHDSIILPAEELHNRRVLGGDSSTYDEGGKRYIAAQQRFLGQKAGNFRTMLLGGMIRGKLYAHARAGTDVYYDYTSTSPLWTIDYQVPSGNLSQLAMISGNIIDTSWANPGANIVAHILAINAAFIQLTGSQLGVMIINSTVWNYIINNDFVIQNAGSSSTAYETYNREEGMAENGKPYVTFEATIKAVPWLKIWITDEGLDLETSTVGTTTWTKFVPDTGAWFGPMPSIDYFEMLEGGEPISEGPNMAQVVKNGLDAWTYNSWNPTATHMFVLDNALPANKVPAATAFGTVVF